MKAPLHCTIVLLFVSALAFGQRTANIAFSGGVTNYTGDLAKKTIFPFSSAIHISIGLST